MIRRKTRKQYSAEEKIRIVLSGLRGEVVHKPRLLSDNGSSYIAGDLAVWLEDQGMDHVRGAPNHPQTQGKIERWHQTLKNRVLLENYYLPGDLERPASAPSSSTTTTAVTTKASPIPHSRRRLLRPGPRHHREKEKDQRTDHP